MDKLLHLGCGELVGEHWHNTDSSLNVFLDNHPWLKMVLSPILPASSRRSKFKNAKYLDLRGRWHWEDGSFDAIYSSHFFEHLSLADGRHVLEECYRCLRPGGVIRFLLPSVQKDVENYLRLKSSGDPQAATQLAESLNVFLAPSPGSWWYRLYLRFYDKNSHKMIYDADSLREYFAAVGFVEISEKNHLDSAIPFLNEVEREDRFQNAICLEAQKPPAARAALPIAS